MSEIVREITETVTWTVVDGPRKCRCGHDHYARVARRGQAPWWGFCEDPTCSCQGFRAKS